MDCCCNCHTSYSIIQIAKYKQCVQNILFAQQTSRPSTKKKLQSQCYDCHGLQLSQNKFLGWSLFESADLHYFDRSFLMFFRDFQFANLLRKRYYFLCCFLSVYYLYSALSWTWTQAISPGLSRNLPAKSGFHLACVETGKWPKFLWWILCSKSKRMLHICLVQSLA